jgi:hypothetical protein
MEAGMAKFFLACVGFGILAAYFWLVFPNTSVETLVMDLLVGTPIVMVGTGLIVPLFMG